MRDIPGYEGLYAATQDGRIWSYRSKKFLKPSDNGLGYLQVKLSKDGKTKTYKVHRLVAEAFIPNPLNLPQINHKDENRANNALLNLEWCDAAYNSNYSKAKKVICTENGEIFESIKEAAIKNNVSKSAICKACRGRLKTAAGYHWAYYYDQKEEI